MRLEAECPTLKGQSFIIDEHYEEVLARSQIHIGLTLCECNEAQLEAQQRLLTALHPREDSVNTKEVQCNLVGVQGIEDYGYWDACKRKWERSAPLLPPCPCFAMRRYGECERCNPERTILENQGALHLESLILTGQCYYQKHYSRCSFCEGTLPILIPNREKQSQSETAGAANADKPFQTYSLFSSNLPNFTSFFSKEGGGS